MRFASIGSPAASPSAKPTRADARSGFSLVEALVALALILAFVATLGPYLFHSRRIMTDAEARLASHVVLRALLAEPLDRSLLAKGPLQGEASGMRWELRAEPIFVPAMMQRSNEPRVPGKTAGKDNTRAVGMPFRVTARVWLGSGLMASADTVRLVRKEDHQEE